jgi:hypothetical protein
MMMHEHPRVIYAQLRGDGLLRLLSETQLYFLLIASCGRHQHEFLSALT